MNLWEQKRNRRHLSSPSPKGRMCRFGRNLGWKVHRLCEAHGVTEVLCCNVMYGWRCNNAQPIGMALWISSIDAKWVPFIGVSDIRQIGPTFSPFRHFCSFRQSMGVPTAHYHSRQFSHLKTFWPTQTHVILTLHFPHTRASTCRKYLCHFLLV